MQGTELAELWRWAVYNKSFDLLHDLTNLKSTFELLSEGKIGFHDKYTIVHTQIRVCELEIEKLKKALSDIGTRAEEFKNTQAEVKIHL